uniref:CUB domain-containing protein n=1 Tax=Ciona savignyi TaxID=51511 RepID=H2ZIZ0_CIOSA
MYFLNKNTFSFYLVLYVISVNLLNETSGYNKQIFVSLEDVVNQTCFSTPGWPNSYENDFRQDWYFDRIIFPTHKIQFTILALDSELYYDTFKIYEGKTLIKSYSGTITSNQTIYSEVGQRPSAYFISDSSVTGKGVKFCVKLVAGENVAQLAANAVRSVTNEVLNLGYWNDTRCGDYTPPDCTDRVNQYYDVTKLCFYDTPGPAFPNYSPKDVGIYKAFQTTPFLYLVQIINVGDIYVHSWFQTIHNIETLVITSGFNGTMSIGDFFVKYFVYQI